jgi:hypothetical protein
MNPEELLAAITKVAEEMKTSVAAHCSALDAKYTALADSIGKMKKRDATDPDDTLAEPVAADEAGSQSRRNEEMRADDLRIANSALASLAREVNGMKKQIARPMGGDLDAFADAQAKADSVMRDLGTRAEPNMPGEDIVAYQIRLARKMQPHSKTWKGVELGIIAADRKAFQVAVDAIHSEAMADSMNTEGMEPFKYREITRTMPGGHTEKTFVGNGTFIKQMSPPVRHVMRIGPRWEGAGA